MSELPHDILRAGQGAIAMYERLLQQGYGHRWAEMCALQSPPATKGTDRSFMQGRYNNEQLSDMPPDHARNIITLARRAGISVSGKYYVSGLADNRGPGDPAAWVDSVHDVKKVAAEKNLTVRGAVEQQGRPMPRPQSKGLSERLTRELMRDEKKRHPTMKKGELREYVKDRYGRKPKS
jgi:hypothetical protein